MVEILVATAAGARHTMCDASPALGLLPQNHCALTKVVDANQLTEPAVVGMPFILMMAAADFQI